MAGLQSTPESSSTARAAAAASPSPYSVAGSPSPAPASPAAAVRRPDVITVPMPTMHVVTAVRTASPPRLLGYDAGSGTYPYHEDVSLVHERLHLLQTESRSAVPPAVNPHPTPFVGEASTELAKLRQKRVAARAAKEAAATAYVPVTPATKRPGGAHDVRYDPATPFHRECRCHPAADADDAAATARAATPQQGNRAYYAKNVKWQRTREAALDRVREKLAAEAAAEEEASRQLATSWSSRPHRGARPMTPGRLEAFVERQRAWQVAKDVSVGLAPAQGMPWREDAPSVVFAEPIRPRPVTDDDVQRYLATYCE